MPAVVSTYYYKIFTVENSQTNKYEVMIPNCDHTPLTHFSIAHLLLNRTLLQTRADLAIGYFPVVCFCLREIGISVR